MKRTVVLTPGASRRLDVYAACAGRTISAVLEELVERHLRRYRVQDFGPDGGEPGPGSEGEEEGAGGQTATV